MAEEIEYPICNRLFFAAFSEAAIGILNLSIYLPFHSMKNLNLVGVIAIVKVFNTVKFNSWFVINSRTTITAKNFSYRQILNAQHSNL